jgi:hypothetical protein
MVNYITTPQYVFMAQCLITYAQTLLYFTLLYFTLLYFTYWQPEVLFNIIFSLASGLTIFMAGLTHFEQFVKMWTYKQTNLQLYEYSLLCHILEIKN